MDRGPILPVPLGIRPVLSKYRVEVIASEHRVLMFSNWITPGLNMGTTASLKSILVWPSASPSLGCLGREWRWRQHSPRCSVHSAPMGAGVPAGWRCCRTQFPVPNTPKGCSEATPLASKLRAALSCPCFASSSSPRSCSGGSGT